MNRIFSNGPQQDIVDDPFSQMLNESKEACLAAPYFTIAKPLLNAARNGTKIRLLIELNVITQPKAVRKMYEEPGVTVRYFVSGFHAKIYIFDRVALVGSANLTHSGLNTNREAVIKLDDESDTETIDEARALFEDLWRLGTVLTPKKLEGFENRHKKLKNSKSSNQSELESELGAAPADVNPSQQQISVQYLSHQIYEQYLPAFHEVVVILGNQGCRRPEHKKINIEMDAVRFLNYVGAKLVNRDKLKDVRSRPDQDDRRDYIIECMNSWIDAKEVPEDHLSTLMDIRHKFRTKQVINGASEDEIINGLFCIHAFLGRTRWTKGGKEAFALKYWQNNDLSHVKSTLVYFLYGPGDFVQRFTDVIEDPARNIVEFGYFSALELYGSIHPTECPPINGRIARALLYLGFRVKV